MKSMNIISCMAILLAAMATPLLSGCATEVDSEDATADDAVASNDAADATTPADAENTGTEQQAFCGGGFGGFGLGGFGGGCGGFGLGLGLGGCGGFGLGGFGLGGFGGCGGFGGFGGGCGGFGGFGGGIC